VLEELGRVLTTKLGFSPARWRAVKALLAELAAAVPDPPETVEAVSGDPADDQVLASALAAGAEVLATGDRRHLLPLGAHRGLRILTPQALLAELGGS
jgi:predicted nucleic acid-binding protein